MTLIVKCPLMNVLAIVPYQIIIVLLLFCILLFAIIYFNKKRVILRTLSKIPRKAVGNFKLNELVKVSGKALHVKDPLIAPYSKRECIFYTFTIEQKVSTGKSSHWKTLISETKCQEFFIDVKGDMVIIEPVDHPRNYISHLVMDKHKRSGIFNKPDGTFQQILNYNKIKSTNILGINKSLRYSEGVIEIGEEVTVAGIAKWKSFKEPLPEYPYSKIACLSSNDNQKLIITDLPESRIYKDKRRW